MPRSRLKKTRRSPALLFAKVGDRGNNLDRRDDWRRASRSTDSRSSPVHALAIQVGVAAALARWCPRLPMLGEGSQPPASDAALSAIKALHTLAWFSIESCMVYVLYAGFMGRSDRRTAVAAGVVAGGSLIFVANGYRCPLTQVAEWLATARLGHGHLSAPMVRRQPAGHPRAADCSGRLPSRAQSPTPTGGESVGGGSRQWLNDAWCRSSTRRGSRIG